MKLSLLILATILLNYACIKKTRSSETIASPVTLNTQLQEVFNQSELPGFSVVATNGKEIAFQQSYGLADIENKIPYTNQTIHNIGSVSKTFIALALMQSVDKGLLSLDDDINKYLPFRVSSPYYPNQPITLRHLANHTSGIIDDEVYQKSYVFSYPNNINSSFFNADINFFLKR